MGRERTLGSTTQATIPAAGLDPAQLAERADLTTRLRLSLELLPERDRRVLVLRDWQGLSFAEVGQDLGIGEEAARGAWRRAVERLRRLMADLRTGGLPAALAAANGDGGDDVDRLDVLDPA